MKIDDDRGQGRAERFAAAAADVSVAAPLTIAGGTLDAFAYVDHGHVFANAMTGNVALMGIAAAAGDWAQAARHIPPLLAFAAAVFLVQALRLDLPRRRLSQTGTQTGLACLLLEIAVLAGLAFGAPLLPDAALIPAISFVATLQTMSLDRLGGWTYTSVMTTGNLRHFVKAGFAGIIPRRDPAALREAALFGTVSACFLAGAVLGAVATTRLHDLALLVPVALLLAALVRLVWLARVSSDPAPAPRA